MSLEDKCYAVYYAASGVTKARATAAFLRERNQADDEWAMSRPELLPSLGVVTQLSVLPLIEFYSSDDRLLTEPGVSYLVTADGMRILFDVGRNVHEEHPSPLLRNMETLGIGVENIDAVFISHCHLDHVGGVGEMRRRTFSLSAGEIALPGTPAYVPTVMTHGSAAIEVITEPRKLADGVASTGAITRAIWLMGPVAEHSLLVNVKEKGLVVIVGCGHPMLSRLVSRARAVTGVPLHAVVGGLHFPVTGSRVGKGGQNIIGNGKLPWQRVTRNEAREAATLLSGLDVGLVALSGHDSCDWSLETFRQCLGDRYLTLRVGEEIVIA